MKTSRSESTFVQLFLLMILFLSGILITGCDSALLDGNGGAETFVDTPDGNTSHAGASFGFVDDPEPGRTGPYKVCTHDYDFSPDRNQYLVGRIYAPVLDDRECITKGRFNLVLIAHADGQGPMLQAHTNYEELARHLASNALMVVSFNRYGLKQMQGAIDIFDQVLEAHLEYLYSSSPIQGFITDDVAMIGHSAGGRSVIRHAGVIGTSGKHQKALIVMAPTVDLNQDYAFHGETEALLGLHVTYDTDVNAFGGKFAGQAMSSTFKIYDDAGIVPGSPNMLTVTKDMIFFEGVGHYFQNTIVSQTYVNAFLQQHLNGHAIFGRFFKHQERPSTITETQAEKIWQQHADMKRFVLADFENGSTHTNATGGSIEATGHLSDVAVGDAFTLDDFSPHNTRVMKFDYKHSVGNGGRVAFDLPQPTDLRDYRYASLRIAQVYHPQDNPDGVARDLALVLRTQGGDATVNIDSVDDPLHFPEKETAPPGALQAEQTKNAMRSYLVPLAAFENIDLSAVDGLTVDFSQSGQGTTTFILDDVEFYH